MTAAIFLDFEANYIANNLFFTMLAVIVYAEV